MQLQPTRRRRGILLTPSGLKKLRQAIDELEYEENYGEKYTLEALSEHTRLDPVTIAKVLEGEVGVDRRTLDRFFRALHLELDSNDLTKPIPQSLKRQEEKIQCQPSSDTPPRQDLSEAVDVSVFYSRTQELAKLKRWIVSDRCRLVAILGMGGIGKTALSVKLVEEIGLRFECVIWKSLRNAPPIQDLLATLIQFVSNHQETVLPTSIAARTAQLLEYLRQHRCLLILDNVESVLKSGSRTGYCCEGYEAYGELFKRVGETNHQSCLVLTSREKPRELAPLEGEALYIRSFQLRGLSEKEGRKILQARAYLEVGGARGELTSPPAQSLPSAQSFSPSPPPKWDSCSGTEHQWRVLVEYYAGNPLALKMVAPAMQLFSTLTEFMEFLKRGNLVFEDIRNLLDRQFERLSKLEREVMYWLAIYRDGVTLAQLRDTLLPPASERRVLEAVISLEWRSLIEKATPTLIEKNATRFTLQPVVMEYVTNHFVEQVCQEIQTEELEWFNRHALLKAAANDQVRETQARLILQPVINGLLRIFHTPEDIEAQFAYLLEKLESETLQAKGYAEKNMLDLLEQMQTNLASEDAQVVNNSFGTGTQQAANTELSCFGIESRQKQRLILSSSSVGLEVHNPDFSEERPRQLSRDSFASVDVDFTSRRYPTLMAHQNAP